MYDNIAILTNTMNNISVEVDADQMRPGKSFDAYIASKVKLECFGMAKYMLEMPMAWNLLLLVQN